MNTAIRFAFFLLYFTVLLPQAGGDLWSDIGLVTDSIAWQTVGFLLFNGTQAFWIYPEVKSLVTRLRQTLPL